MKFILFGILIFIVFSMIVDGDGDSTIKNKASKTPTSGLVKAGRIFLSLLLLLLIFLVFLIFVALPSICLLFMCINAFIPHRERELFIPNPERLRPNLYKI